jgi:hypothetical protein
MFTKEENTNGVKRAYISVSPLYHPCKDVYSCTQIEGIHSITEQRMQTVAHLVGSFIGEGDSDNLGWWYIVVQDKMCYSVCECACLSAAGSCEYLQGNLRRMHDS